VSGERPSGLTVLANGGVAFATKYEELCVRGAPSKPERLHVVDPEGRLGEEQPIIEPAEEAGLSTQDIVTDPTGRILVLGVARNIEGGELREILRRYLSNGSTDKSFGEDGATTVPLPGSFLTVGLAVDSADRPIVAAVAEATDSPLTVTRLTAAGKADRAFGSNGTTTTKFDAGLYNPPPAILGVGIDGKNRATVAARLLCKSRYSGACRPVLARYLWN
jgi:hypothetical protein